MRKHLAIIGLPLLLGGCGLPPAISVASWAIDGISYVASGKSVTDHAISQVMQQDCALFRVVQEREICAEGMESLDDGPQILAAAAPQGDNWLSGDALADDPLAVPVEIVGFAHGFGPGEDAFVREETTAFPVSASWRAQVPDPVGRFDAAAPKVRPANLTTPVYDIAALRPQITADVAVEGPRTVSVVGSFQSHDNARNLAASYASLGSGVQSLEVDGRTWHRVVVDAPLADVREMGAVDAWALKVCGAASGPVPCNTADRHAFEVDLPQVAQLN